MRTRVVHGLIVGAALFQGCGQKSEPAFAPPPASVILEDRRHVSIRREVFFVDGVVPPANPTTGATTPPSAFDGLKQLVAPIGPNRPMAGKLRSDPDAFQAVTFSGTTHIDGVVGTDRPGSPVAELHRQVIEFIRKQTPAGGVSVPRVAP